MESLISNFQEIELHETQLVVKQLHSVRMLWFEQLETHLSNLYHNKLSRAADAFKPAFFAFFGAEPRGLWIKIFKDVILPYHQVKLFRSSSQCWAGRFQHDMYCDHTHEITDVINALKENGRQLHDEILHEHQIMKSVKMQSQDIRINPVQAVDDSLIVSKNSLIESENNNALSKSEIETQMHMREEKVDMREALDVGLVVTESSGTNPDKQDTSSSSENYTTHAVDANIGPVNDEEPFAEVQLTAQHNILANEQQHTEQSEPSYDTHLLETIDSNTTPNSTNMCHKGGEIVLRVCTSKKSPLLNAEFFRTKDMVENDVYNELSNRFLKLEKHCISLEFIQQKGESCSRNNTMGHKESYGSNDKAHTFFLEEGLRWIPTGKMFTDSTTNIDSEPLNGSNDDIANPYECDQTLYFSAVQASFLNVKWRLLASLQAPFLKEKKGVRFSALYLQKKRNLLVFDHSHQQVGSNSEQSQVALAGPNPKHMHDVFLATNYPKVHESLKHTTKEHVYLENPPSSSRTLSSMKNLEDNFTFGDQVINDKSQEDEPGKTTVESKVESMVIDPIQQASSSAPPLNTHVIDLSSPSQN
ncbi:hypothetical protein Tco_0033300 [Tanacetum coccineum]